MPAPAEVKTCPLVPVDPFTVKAPVNDNVVKKPAAGVVAPMDILLIVPSVAGLIVSVPDPVGAIEIVALAGFILNAPSKVKLTPPPAPHCKQAAPLALRKEPPPEPLASK